MRVLALTSHLLSFFDQTRRGLQAAPSHLFNNILERRIRDAAVSSLALAFRIAAVFEVPLEEVFQYEPEVS